MGEEIKKKFEEYSTEDFKALDIDVRCKLLMGCRAGLKRFFKLATEEEKAHWKGKAMSRSIQVRSQKAEDRNELLQTLQKNFPLIEESQHEAELQQAEWMPTEEILETARSLYRKGMTIEDLREKMIKAGLKQKNWPRFSDFVFKRLIPNSEVVGLDLISTYRNLADWTENAISRLEKKVHANPKLEAALLRQILDLQKFKADKMMQLGSLLLKDVVPTTSQKPKGITINLNIPRPDSPKNVFEVEDGHQD